jgi:hypothetical protein
MNSEIIDGVGVDGTRETFVQYNKDGSLRKRQIPANLGRPKRYSSDEAYARALARKRTKVQWFVTLPPALKLEIDALKLETGIKSNEEFVIWLLERGRRSIDRKNGGRAEGAVGLYD